jgi:hypothetical protein
MSSTRPSARVRVMVLVMVMSSARAILWFRLSFMEGFKLGQWLGLGLEFG